MALDPRIVQVTVEVNGVSKTYASPFSITANGMKYANALQNEAEIILENLDRETQDYLLTETTPYNLNTTPKIVTLSAGRVSTGTFVVFTGNIVSSVVSQPPDIGIVLKCLTGNFFKGNIITTSQPGQATLLQVATRLAQVLNATLNFQATDKNLGNYQFAGGALKQVELLNAAGGVNAYLDDNVLVVKNAGAFLTGSNTTQIISAQTGMVGIPEFTEQGIKVKFLINNNTVLGGKITVNSVQYPAANGDYIIYKLGFQISTRDVPFYYIAEAARIR